MLYLCMEHDWIAVDCSVFNISKANLPLNFKGSYYCVTSKYFPYEESHTVI